MTYQEAYYKFINNKEYNILTINDTIMLLNLIDKCFKKEV